MGVRAAVNWDFPLKKENFCERIIFGKERKGKSGARIPCQNLQDCDYFGITDPAEA